MTAKEFLNKVRQQNYVLRQAERELADMHKDITSLNAASMAEKVSGTKNSDLSDKYIRLERYIEQVTQERDTLITMRKEAKAMIGMLPDERQQAVLYARYINCGDWERVAADMHYSMRGIFRLHGIALQSFERVHRSALHKGI